MTAEEYHAHECPAYLNLEWKNPLEHKLSLARWKIPGADLKAKGSVLTGDQIEEYIVRNAPRPYKFPWILTSILILMVALGVWLVG